MVRIEVPVGDGFVTKDRGLQSIFGIDYCDEQTARAEAKNHCEAPVSAYSIASHFDDREKKVLVDAWSRDAAFAESLVKAIDVLKKRQAGEVVAEPIPFDDDPDEDDYCGQCGMHYDDCSC